MSGHYPAGVDDSHPHFNPEAVECPHCGEESFSETCENCGSDVPSPDEVREDLAAEAAERAFEARRDGP